ncbi:MAG: ABC transporter permease [Trueperaceae bacterium]|nr:ABC transporter permease [Trueperaceae bacterium]
MIARRRAGTTEIRRDDRDRLGPFGRFYVTFVVVAVVGPFIPLLIASFAFRWNWPDLLPSRWWWEARETARLPLGWDYVFSPVSRVLESAGNTVLIALLVTLLCTLISLPAARVLARERFRGKSFVEFFLLTPLIVPEIAVGLGILVTFIQLGLAGTFTGIILVHLIPTIPYMVRVLTSVFQGLSRDYEEQARVLGAGPLRTMWHVTLPMIMPGVIAGGLFAFLISSNIFLLTFFIGRGRIETLPTLLFSRVSGGGALDAVAAGVALIVCIPGIIMLVLTERFIKEEVFAKGFGG